jgi:hypothetical protein
MCNPPESFKTQQQVSHIKAVGTKRLDIALPLELMRATRRILELGSDLWPDLL